MPLGKSVAVLLFLISSFLAVLPYAWADDAYNSTLTVSVDLVEPAARVEINPSSADFGEITKGYTTSFRNITFNNTGNLDIAISPVLNGEAHEIFSYLEFNTASCSESSDSGWHNMSYYSNTSRNALLNLKKPDAYGGQNTDYSCIRLNLQDYSSDIPANASLSADVTFWVMPV